MDLWQTYGRSIVAAVMAVLMVVASAVTDGKVDTAERIQIAVAVVTAISVYIVPNLRQWPWAKGVIAFLLAGLNAVGALLVDGHLHLTPAQWVNVIIAALGAIFVAKAPSLSLGQTRR